ncbi:hypothetical protein B0T25DRAFT_364140 [Lasiosphaeria hispida]|uniref:Uncharacterized protein n=1 Tax=Lasiosphaeria hispida TaxID=260671 RepID=A0AAJ0H584_9PEZI|nr:hypothetical protein B0T25DRAFT_364140 [Lasiosphaeria hispida]
MKAQMLRAPNPLVLMLPILWVQGLSSLSSLCFGLLIAAFNSSSSSGAELSCCSSSPGVAVADPLAWPPMMFCSISANSWCIFGGLWNLTKSVTEIFSCLGS